FLPTDDKPASGADFSFQLERASVPEAAFDLLLHPLEQGLEAVEVLASVPVGYLLGGAFIGSRTDMPQFGDVVRGVRVHAELRQQFVVADVIGSAGRSGSGALQKPLMIERRKLGAAFVQLAETIEPHRIQSLENVASFAVPWCSPLLLNK